MSETQEQMKTNPLLDTSGLPRFDAIEAEHVVPGVRALLDELEADFEALESEVVPTWAGLIEPLERMGDRLAYSWGVVGHLMGVRNSDALRAAHEEMQPAVVAMSLRQGQSQAVYRGLRAMREGEEWARLDAAQRRIVDVMLRDAEHSGVALEGEAKERFNAIAEDLAGLGTKFSNHVLDATKGFSLLLRCEGEVAGLPESWRELAAQSAREGRTIAL